MELKFHAPGIVCARCGKPPKKADYSMNWAMLTCTVTAECHGAKETATLTEQFVEDLRGAPVAMFCPEPIPQTLRGEVEAGRAIWAAPGTWAVLPSPEPEPPKSTICPCGIARADCEYHR